MYKAHCRKASIVWLHSPSKQTKLSNVVLKYTNGKTIKKELIFVGDLCRMGVGLILGRVMVAAAYASNSEQQLEAES